MHMLGNVIVEWMIEHWMYWNWKEEMQWWSDEVRRQWGNHGFELHDHLLSFIDLSGNIIIEISHLTHNCCHSLVVIVADCDA